MKNKGLAVLAVTAALSASLVFTPFFGCLQVKNPSKPMKNAEMVMGQAQENAQDQGLLLQTKNTVYKEKQMAKITPN